MTDISKIKELIESVDKLAGSGFAIGCHLQMTSPELLLQTYPKEWTDIYSEKSLVMVDPTVRWGFTEVGAIRWSALKDQDDQNILGQCATYGMAFGVMIAIDMDNSRSIAGFSRPDREFTDAEISQLSQCTKTIHELTASSNGMDANLREELLQFTAKFAR